MMQVGGTHKLTIGSLIINFGSTDEKAKHVYEKKKTSWAELIQPYQDFSQNPTEDLYNKLILQMLKDTKECGRYSDYLMNFV